eukprot:COSAG01_NODE_1275_length_10938_cov_100.784482_13_plen_83_part_00
MDRVHDGHARLTVDPIGGGAGGGCDECTLTALMDLGSDVPTVIASRLITQSAHDHQAAPRVRSLTLPPPPTGAGGDNGIAKM